jgi:hypothetical protein
MYLKSGGVPAVLSGAMISMGRTLEKQVPSVNSPECVEGKFSEVARRGVYSLYSGSKQEESAACRVFSMG